MNTPWGKIVFKILCWLFLEVVFNLIGIDDLVDYSEFLLTQNYGLKMKMVNLSELVIVQLVTMGLLKLGLKLETILNKI